MRVSNFIDDLVWGKSAELTPRIRKIVSEVFDCEPENIWSATTTEDKSGIDIWAHSRSGQDRRIDVKRRSQDRSLLPHGPEDVALEVWSSIEGRLPGWTRSEKRTDATLHIWDNSDRLLILPFRATRSMFLKYAARGWNQHADLSGQDDWYGHFKHAIQETRRENRIWHSECLFVPVGLLWQKLKEEFTYELHAKAYRKVDERREMNYTALLLNPWPEPLVKAPLPIEFEKELNARISRSQDEAARRSTIQTHPATNRSLRFPGDGL